jgi:hypothetical protein
LPNLINSDDLIFLIAIYQDTKKYFLSRGEKERGLKLCYTRRHSSRRDQMRPARGFHCPHEPSLAYNYCINLSIASLIIRPAPLTSLSQI